MEIKQTNTRKKKDNLPFCCTFCLLLSSLFLGFCEWLVPLILVFDRSPVLPPVFVCCFRLPKLWRNSAFPFLCSTRPCLPLGFLLGVWFASVFSSSSFGLFFSSPLSQAFCFCVLVSSQFSSSSLVLFLPPRFPGFFGVWV
jgi:hypothetical protein